MFQTLSWIDYTYTLVYVFVALVVQYNLSFVNLFIFNAFYQTVFDGRYIYLDAYQSSL